MLFHFSPSMLIYIQPLVQTWCPPQTACTPKQLSPPLAELCQMFPSPPPITVTFHRQLNSSQARYLISEQSGVVCTPPYCFGRFLTFLFSPIPWCLCAFKPARFFSAGWLPFLTLVPVPLGTFCPSPFSPLCILPAFPA